MVQGPIKVARSMPWSAVLSIPTNEGQVYFKAVSPLDPHEPPLLEAMARWRPDCLPKLLSVSSQRGWVLMRDGGPMLRDTIRSTRDIRPWMSVLPRYAELQMEMAGHVPELLALGVPDRRLSVLPSLYEPLLADVGVLRIDQQPGLTSVQYTRLSSMVSRVVELCNKLARYPIPETLNHGDLNDGNVLVRDDESVFIDWGDSCVSHPFYSLRTVLVSAEISLGLEENAAELHPLRDAYLEPFTRYAPRRDVLAALAVASKLASLNGALTWYRLVSKLDDPQRDDYAEPVPALLQEFLSAEDAPSVDESK
jgi:hypothetical protein